MNSYYGTACCKDKDYKNCLYIGRIPFVFLRGYAVMEKEITIDYIHNLQNDCVNEKEINPILEQFKDKNGN